MFKNAEFVTYCYFMEERGMKGSEGQMMGGNNGRARGGGGKARGGRPVQPVLHVILNNLIYIASNIHYLL